MKILPVKGLRVPRSVDIASLFISQDRLFPAYSNIVARFSERTTGFRGTDVSPCVADWNFASYFM